MSTDYRSRKPYRSEDILLSNAQVTINVLLGGLIIWVVLTAIAYLQDPSAGLTSSLLQALAYSMMLIAALLLVNHLASAIMPLPRPLEALAEFSAEHADAFFIVIGILYLLGSIGFDVYHGESLLHVYVPAVR